MISLASREAADMKSSPNMTAPAANAPAPTPILKPGPTPRAAAVGMFM